MKRKAFLAGFAACYVMGGLFFAAAGYRAIPCMTKAGSAYYGALWPLSPLSVAVNQPLYPIANWACTDPGDAK